MKKNEHMDLARSRFPILFLFLMMSVFHMKTERAAFFGNYLCNDFRNSYRKINSADCYDGFRKRSI